MVIRRIVKTIDRFVGNLTVRMKLLMAFYLVSLIPVAVISVLYYDQANKSLENEIGLYTVEITKQVERSLTAFSGELDQMVNLIRYNNSVQHMLSMTSYEGTDQQVQSLVNIQELFAMIGNTRNHVQGIFLVNDAGISVYDAPRIVVDHRYPFREQEWFKRIQGIGMTFVPTHKQEYARVQDRPVISFGYRLTQLSQYKESGTLWIDFDPRFIDEMNKKVVLGQTGSVFLLTDEGVPINPPEFFRQDWLTDETFQSILKLDAGYRIVNVDHQDLLIGISSLPEMGMKIIGIVPFHEISAGIRHMQYDLMIIVGLIVLFIFIISYSISKAITSPIKSLIQSMSKAGRGDFTLKVPVERSDEIGILGKRFNQMLAELHKLKEEVYLASKREFQLQSLHREAEFKALQAQINPHFLYNTLNTMSCIGEYYDVSEVVSISDALSEMFKYCTYGKAVVTLEEEINHIKSFIQIMQIRYPDEFEIEIDVPEQLLQAQVIQLMLQPIIENAFNHGLIPKAGKGILRVQVRRQWRLLAIRIEDNGAGMNEQAKQRISALLSETNTGKLSEDSSLSAYHHTGHIGLINVYQRLKLQYGDNADMNVISVLGKGTIVELIFPFEEVKGGAV